MKEKKESKISKIRKIVATIILILFVIGLIKLIPTFASLVTEEGRIAFEQKVETLGMKGASLILGLEVCKIILIVLPGEPIELLAGMCYGPLWGLIIIYIGVVLSNAFIVLAVKKYGVSFVQDAMPEEKIEKIKGMITENPNKSDITLFLLYFLPALPKDLITYVASLLPIPKGKVIFISTLGRFPAVISSVLVGSKILDGDIKTIILIYAVTYLISGVLAFIYKKYFSKEKREERKRK